MAAYLVFKNGQERTWHVGYKPFDSKEEIKEVDFVQIDGHEAELIYGVDISFNHKQVHKLTSNESKLYCLLIQALYMN